MVLQMFVSVVTIVRLRELIEDIIEDFSALGPTLLRKAYSVTQHIAALYTF